MIDTTFKKKELTSNVTTVILYILLFLYRKYFTNNSLIAYSVILVGSINFIYVLNLLFKFLRHKESLTSYVKRRNLLIIRLLANLVFVWIVLRYKVF